MKALLMLQLRTGKKEMLFLLMVVVIIFGASSYFDGIQSFEPLNIPIFAVIFLSTFLSRSFNELFKQPFHRVLLTMPIQTKHFIQSIYSYTLIQILFITLLLLPFQSYIGYQNDELYDYFGSLLTMLSVTLIVLGSYLTLRFTHLKKELSGQFFMILFGVFLIFGIPFLFIQFIDHPPTQWLRLVLPFIIGCLFYYWQMKAAISKHTSLSIDEN